MERNGDLKLVDVIDAASRRLSEKFADDPGVQSELHAAIGRTYIGLANTDAAQREVKAALDHLSALDDRPGEKARVLHVAARMDFEMGRWESAEARQREAVALFASSPDAKTDAAMHSVMLNNFAMILRLRGKSGEAQENLTQAVRLLETLPAPPAFEIGVLHNNIAMLAEEAGNLSKTRQEDRLAIEKLSILPDPPVNLAQVESALGIQDRMEGDFEAGIALEEKAVAAGTRAAGPDHPATLLARIDLDYLRSLTGRSAGLDADLSHLLELSRRPGSRGVLAAALEALGHVRTAAGRARDAEPLLREALARRKTEPQAVYPLAMAEETLAECLERQNRMDEAQPLYQAAYGRLNKLYGPNLYATRQAALHLR
jgi:tetratricopeptide (TPR) repeat protein